MLRPHSLGVAIKQQCAAFIGCLMSILVKFGPKSTGMISNNNNNNNNGFV